MITDTHVLVIGAGPVGLAAALFFAKRKYKVILIEQYGEVKSDKGRGLNPKSLEFLKVLDNVVYGNVCKKGCVDQDWINIPVYMLQNILIKEVKNYNTDVMFHTTIIGVHCFDESKNCLVTLLNNNTIRGVTPQLIVIADGKQHQACVASKFFGFPSVSMVRMQTFGIVGMLQRESGSVCLKNISHNNYKSTIMPQLGNMFIRLLGDMAERYVAIGVFEDHCIEKFKNLTAVAIKQLLLEAYNSKRDVLMGEQEITEFNECSTKPIQIVLDYRKETIKVFEGSNTIVSVDGDSSRKSSMFVGHGLNSGYEALHTLFKLCDENKHIIFNNNNVLHNILIMDQKLLEKDQACMTISLALLKKGLSYYNVTSEYPTDCINNDTTFINLITPDAGEAGWYVKIHGENLQHVKNCTFTWQNQHITTPHVIIYNNKLIGVKIPKNATNNVGIILNTLENTVVESPFTYTVSTITEAPIITNVHQENEWLCIDGQNFIIPIYVHVNNQEPVKAYCHSINSIAIHLTYELINDATFTVSTVNGTSNQFVKNAQLIKSPSTFGRK
jgi:hypothetical protein